MAVGIDATTEMPVYACCPPGYHEVSEDCAVPYCPNAEIFAVPRAWFTFSFIHAVWMCGNYPQWSARIGDDGRMVMTYRGVHGHYVWRLTGVRGGPKEFWHEGRWPD